MIRRVTIEATGGHRELQEITSAVMKAVEKLRQDAVRDQQEMFNLGHVGARAFVHGAVSINLEGTIRLETEDNL